MNLKDLLDQETVDYIKKDTDHIQRGRYVFTRTPVLLALDISGSMSVREKITQLNYGKRNIMKELRGDRRANNSCDFAAVTFNDEVTEVQPFTPLPECPDLPDFQADGRTKLAEAVRKALEMIDAQEQSYRSSDMKCHCPMLWIMTDGRSVGEKEEMVQEVVKETANRVQAGTLKVYAMAIGDDADIETLKALANGAEPLQVGDHEITRAMREISNSVISVSRDVEYLLHGNARPAK